MEEHFGQSESSGLDRYVPKVTDLGIVKDLSRDDGFTRTREYLGTPNYMAPEQVKGSTDHVDCRTDVYAVGGVLYELLTGHPPFRAGSPLDTMLLVKHEEPVAPSRFQPRLPRDLETICLKCLDKDPARRYQSAQLLADDLDRWLQGKPILARRTPWPSKLWRWSRRNPGWAAAVLLAAATLLALAIGGPLVARHERELRDQAIEQEHQAQLEHTRARNQFELASQALESTLDQVLRSSRLQDSALDDVRASLIRAQSPITSTSLTRTRRTARSSCGRPARCSSWHRFIPRNSKSTKLETLIGEAFRYWKCSTAMLHQTIGRQNSAWRPHTWSTVDSCNSLRTTCPKRSATIEWP